MRTRLKVDSAGRIVLPQPVRAHFHLEAGALIDLEVEEGRIILRPPAQAQPLVDEKGLLVHEGEPGGDLLKAIESVRARRDRDNLGPAR